MKISVIIAVYNVEEYLRHCIESLIQQPYCDAEFILVDDGSTDGSGQICDNAQIRDARIRVIHKPNGGLSDARNAGVDLASGDYIMFLDGDDVLDKGTLEILSSVARNTGADFLQYGYRETSKADLRRQACYEGGVEVVTDRHEMYLRLLKMGGEGASGCTKLIRRQIFENIRFAKGRLHEDEFFTSELLAQVTTAAYLPGFKPYQYVIREGSIIKSGFNPKRVRDIMQMYGRRIELLADMGFKDIVQMTLTKYFESLYIQYHKAKNAQDTDAAGYILQKLESLSKKRINGGSPEIRLAKTAPKIMCPLFFSLRALTRRKIN